jgi:hypothetical protein
MKVYDEEYMNGKIAAVIKAYVKQLIINIEFYFLLNRYLPDLRSILLDLTDAVEGRTAVRQIPEPTKAKPFNLTAPKARTVPIPKIVRINITSCFSYYFLSLEFRFQK